MDNRRLILSLIILIIPLFPCDLFAQNDESFGYLKIDMNVDSATFVANNDFFSIYKIANGDSVLLPAGTNLINLSIPFDRKKETYISIQADTTVNFSHDFKTHNLSPDAIQGNVAAKYHYNANLMILTDDDSDIFIGDSLIGTGFAKFELSDRKAKVTIQNPTFGQSQHPIKIKDSRVNFREFYHRPKRPTARFLSFLPGGSQLYKRQYIKSGLILGISAILIRNTIDRFSDYSYNMDLFNEYSTRYDKATSPLDALKWAELAESQSKKIKQLDGERKALLISTILIYSYNIYDAYASHPSGGYEADHKPLEFYLSQDQMAGNHINTGTLRVNF